MPVIASTSIAQSDKFADILAIISNSPTITSQIPTFTCIEKIQFPNGTFLINYLDEDEDIVASISASITGPSTYKVCFSVGESITNAILTETDEFLLTEDSDVILLEA